MKESIATAVINMCNKYVLHRSSDLHLAGEDEGSAEARRTGGNIMRFLKEVKSMDLFRFLFGCRKEEGQKLCPKCGAPLFEDVCLGCGYGVSSKDSAGPPLGASGSISCGLDYMDMGAFFHAMDNPDGGENYMDMLLGLSDLILSAEENIRKTAPLQIYIREGDFYAHLSGIERLIRMVNDQVRSETPYGVRGIWRTHV